MIRRRHFLHLLSIGALTGCLSARTGSESSSNQSGGAPPPWVLVGSPADVVVENQGASTTTVTLSVDGGEQSITLDGSDYWVSENILTCGETATISVTTEDELQATIDWVPEQTTGNRVVEFRVYDDRIETVSIEQDETQVNPDGRTMTPTASATCTDSE